MKITESKPPTAMGRKMVPAFALAAIVATLSISLSPAGAVAGHGRLQQRSADVSFTKWVVAKRGRQTPSRALTTGVVGGDVGRGSLRATVISDDTKSRTGFWLAHARYTFQGRLHSFVADIHVTENDVTVPNVAIVEGVVTRGWMKGARLAGGYTVLTRCPLATHGNVGTVCIRGSLHLQRDDAQ